MQQRTSSEVRQRFTSEKNLRERTNVSNREISLEEKVAALKKKKKSLQPLYYSLLVVFLLALSFSLGYYTHVMLARRASTKETVSNQIILTDSGEAAAFPPSHVGFLSEEEKKKEALRLFNLAAQYSGEKGEGRLGWLYLLAAYSLDKSNPHIVSNLLQNYQAVHYDNLAYSTLMESDLPLKAKRALLSEDIREEWKEKFFHLKQQLTQSQSSIDLLGPGCFTQLFSTVIATWNLEKIFAEQELNRNIYERSIEAYQRLRRENPMMSATDLNHRFFRVQMADLDDSGTFWNPLTSVNGFEELVLMMRRSAVRFLRDYHGWSEEAAIRKASHSLVVWISVHTEESTHQPHVTEDALIGGVYYVNTPEGSGPLDLYDPRGKHPLYGLQDPTSPPGPPFHRTHSIKPKESLLVLFPGWLVHSVRTVSKQENADFKGRYRVSMSLNLKGEWIDTSNAAFGCPTEQ